MSGIADPREFNGLLLGNASIVNHGKIGKCLQLIGQDEFGALGDQHIGNDLGALKRQW